MKKLFFLIFFLTTSIINAQKNVTLKIVDATINDKLENRGFHYETPLYLVNKNYILYQENGITKNINADVKTFKFPKYDESHFFALDKNGIYFKGKIVEKDTVGFKILASLRNTNYQEPREIIWKTATKVYKNTNEVTANIDVASFKPVTYSSEFYFKDKNFIYYKTEKIEGSDSSTASESMENKIYDKNNVYIDGKIATYKGENLQPVNGLLMKTSSFVVSTNLVEQPHIDAKSLVFLSKNYSKDKNNVYYLAEKTPIKPNNFHNVKVWDQVNSRYVTDGIKIYTGANYIIEGFDAKTFGVLPNSDFWFDKNGIYQRKYNEKTQKTYHEKFPFVYAKNFSGDQLNNSNIRYILYKNQAYDPWDKKYFNNLTNEQINAVKNNKLDLSNIEKGKTNNKKTIEYMLYEANGKIYFNDIETQADAATFKRVTEFFKDKNNVYSYNGRDGLTIIEGFDVPTYERFHYFSTDKNYLYHYNTRIIKNKDIELLGVFSGYRKGCGLDKTPSSDYYLLKNIDAYWLVLVSDTVSIRNLGKKLEGNLKNYEVN